MARHKGKVERAVPIVRKHLLAGRIFCDILEANERALHWCREEIDMEIHGTTRKKPYPAFLAEEKPHCLALPSTPFERPLGMECTVHPDHHIVFDKSYYSLPTRYIGKKVWVKGTRKTAEIFLDQERIKVHPRSHTPGRWVTDQSDYPGEQIKTFRKQYRLSKRALAEHLPVSKNYIYMVEASLRNPSKTFCFLLDRVAREIQERKEVKRNGQENARHL